MSSQSDPASSIVSYVLLCVANGAGWLTSDFAGQVVTIASTLVFGGLAVYTQVCRVLDNRRVARELLPTRIRLAAEQLERESKANAGTGEHVQL